MTHALRAALNALDADQSITETLTGAGIAPLGSPTLIEAMYEAQAGTYTAEADVDRIATYTREVARVFAREVDTFDDILDVGTGEGNRLIAALQHSGHRGRVRAVDISWSRLSWTVANATGAGLAIDVAVADAGNLPMPDGSVDWVLSVHALEPNTGRQRELLAEMARVARKGVLLIEPDWEIATPAQRERMIRLGFVPDIRAAAADAGLTLLHSEPLAQVDNPDNPSGVFVLEPQGPWNPGPFAWRDPVDREPLLPFGGGLRTRMGLFYPVLASIPFLRADDALMAANPAPGVS